MDMYKYNLNTYIIPPTDSCTLYELEQLCEERLQLYKIMDEAHNLDYKPNSNVWDNYVELEVTKHNLRTYTILLKNEECTIGITRARRNNHIAHWLLSLCYCGSNHLRNFFINCEIRWFVMLYKRTNKDDLKDFFIQNELNQILVNEEEKNRLKENLIKCKSVRESNFDSINYYKVVFTEVDNLVSKRKVFLYKGFAYFPESDLIHCVKNKLWKQFSKQLLWMKKALPTNIKEARFENLLNNIPVVAPTYKRFSDKKVKINLENIDEIANTHFPLCMKTIHSILRAEHHLKYDCKMQYGIFLKWVGLSYQHAMELWKSEFTKNMSSDWFDRKYSYLFKYQYGLVGAKVHYKPYTCETILNSCPGPGQHHGCPFKHWDLERLSRECRSDGFTTSEMNDLREIVVENKYTEACTLYFSVTHKVYMTDVIKSPNQYAEASYEFEESLSNCFKRIFEEC